MSRASGERGGVGQIRAGSQGKGEMGWALGGRGRMREGLRALASAESLTQLGLSSQAPPEP